MAKYKDYGSHSFHVVVEHIYASREAESNHPVVTLLYGAQSI